MLLKGHFLETPALFLLQRRPVSPGQHQNILAPRFVLAVILDRGSQRHRKRLLELLGQLAAQRDPAVPEVIVQFLQSPAQVVGSLVEDRRAFLPLKLGQNIPSLLLVCRQKSLKAESSGGHPGHGQSSDQGAGSGQRSHSDPLLETHGCDHFAGIGDGGRSRVRHDRDTGAAMQFRDQLLGLCVLIIFVIAGERLFDPEVVEQSQCVACVLRCDQIHRLQCAQNALRNIAQIPYGRGAEVEGSGLRINTGFGLRAAAFPRIHGELRRFVTYK